MSAISQSQGLGVAQPLDWSGIPKSGTDASHKGQYDTDTWAPQPSNASPMVERRRQIDRRCQSYMCAPGSFSVERRRQVDRRCQAPMTPVGDEAEPSSFTRFEHWFRRCIWVVIVAAALLDLAITFGPSR